MKLTEKQRRFADEYIRLGNATEAALNAGYSKKTARAIGSENLTKPDIKAYIDKRLDELKKESIAEQDEILQFLTKVLRGQAKGTELVGLGMGEQAVEQVPPTVSERTRAAELLGKRYMMWADKQQVEVVVPTFIEDVPQDDD
ncbi:MULTISPECIES: terminase small subunit [Bhargavaea]|uniref:Terminase small subunit n=1 Tax=Bhargavaea changchunensis TaxID=2134037 RepID=A0ABW2NEN2_9BACL|nr:terminase small subunit [Bhargavaea sp. CC-171006]